jgi:c(7)-type cytochrome triheme protein
MRTGGAPARARRAALLLLFLVVPALLAMPSAGHCGEGIDHAELGKVLKTIPPNGPFWSFGNVVMRSKSRAAGLPPVVFAHWSHRARYTCRVCHQELGFGMRLGDTGITRNQILAGKTCGSCHNGTTAFAAKDAASCKKCHMENTAELERRFDDFSAYLPMSRFGNAIDWAAALNRGRVTPANSLDGQVTLPFPEKLKQPLKLGTNSPRSDVTFSHQEHFAELDCSSCHPDIFNIKKKSTADFTMETNIYGNFCGACHMQVAFPMNDCRRCHKSMNSRG